ncbi:twin-arginine translocation signal domain-containing protein [Proteiniphilum sp. X52]|uniref:twin-arginine translocation signal domain-containing protein n=1 Tax=Proteiniphilum sp. X52 TaxID=2382159 RepID=UPI000F09FEE5|nr:twin-arginine translocation signal domain-containing protein [Proteiniphilum sp. X52]
MQTINRRNFLKTSAIAGAGLTLAPNLTFAQVNQSNNKPVLLGGSKPTYNFSGWPVHPEEKLRRTIFKRVTGCLFLPIYISYFMLPLDTK